MILFEFINNILKLKPQNPNIYWFPMDDIIPGSESDHDHDLNPDHDHDQDPNPYPYPNPYPTDIETIVINNHINNPTGCQAGICNNCSGNISARNFVCRYRPNPGMKYGGDFTEQIYFCDHHYSQILLKNNGVSPEPYYEYYLGEAIFELIMKYV